MVNVLACHHEDEGVRFFHCLVGIIFFNAHWIWISQNRLQKVSIFTFKFIKKLYHGLEYQYSYVKKLNNSHISSSHKFEKIDYHLTVLTNRLSFFFKY
jgi:hypothetical protein